MAQITVHPEVTHRLADHACGVNMGVYYYQDMNSPFYRDLFAESHFEIFRAFTVGRSITYGFYPATKSFAVHMQQRLGNRFALMLGTPVMPSPQPAASLNPFPGISTTPGFSLAEHRAFYRSLVQAGVKVPWWQPVNEPHLNSYEHEGNDLGPATPWFHTGPTAASLAFAAGVDAGSDAPGRSLMQVIERPSTMWRLLAALGVAAAIDPSLNLRLFCNDWITARWREIAAAYHVEIGALGQDTEVIGPAEANIESHSGYDLVRNFITGTMYRGTSPHVDRSNIPHLDGLTFHPYHGILTANEQEQLNQLLFDDGKDEVEYRRQSPPGGSFLQPMRLLRKVLDENGGAHIRIGADESGSNGKTGKAALHNVLLAVAACKVPGFGRLITHSFSRTATTSNDGQLLLADEFSPDPYRSAAELKPGPRYFAARDVWAKYMSTYKDQVRVTVTGSRKTPGFNGIDSTQVVVGMDSTRRGLMLVNAHLGLPEDVTMPDGGTLTLAPGEFRLIEETRPQPQPARLRRSPKSTANKLVLEHDPVPGAAGFRLSHSLTAKRPHTWDGTRTEHSFPVGAEWYRVEPLEVLDDLEYRP